MISKTKIFLQIYKAVIFIICLSLFTSLMLEIWYKYNSEKTMLGLRFIKEPSGQLKLPCITICPWQAYKKPGFYYQKEDYIANTFKKNEIFNEGNPIQTPQFLNTNTSEQVDTLYFGTCHKICNHTKSRANALFIKQDLVIFLHEPDDEMWLPVGIPANGIVYLVIKASSKTISFNLGLREKRTTQLSTKLNPCSDATSGSKEFNECMQKSICEMAKTRINCSIYPLRNFLGPGCQFPLCQNSQDASNSFDFFFSEIQMNHMEGLPNQCLKPCFEKSYAHSVRYFHKNAAIESKGIFGHNFTNINFMMDLFFDTDLIEEHTESLIYDKSAFWSSVGGNLGLYLGFSCFSVAMAMFEVVRKCQVKMMKTGHKKFGTFPM